MDKNILEVIESADESGTYRFVAGKRWVRPDIAASDVLRQLLNDHFGSFTSLSLAMRRKKRWTDGLDATVTQDAIGNWTVSVNLAQLLLLPGVQPKTELDELAAFLGAMKPFFETHAAARASVQFVLHRPRGKAPFCTVQCSRPIAGTLPYIDADQTSRLQAMVDASPTLQVFLANLARAGLQVGPWEFYQVTETMLYGLVDGPWVRRFLEQQRLALLPAQRLRPPALEAIL